MFRQTSDSSVLAACAAKVSQGQSWSPCCFERRSRVEEKGQQKPWEEKEPKGGESCEEGRRRMMEETQPFTVPEKMWKPSNMELFWKVMLNIFRSIKPTIGDGVLFWSHHLQGIIWMYHGNVLPTRSKLGDRPRWIGIDEGRQHGQGTMWKRGFRATALPNFGHVPQHLMIREISILPKCPKVSQQATSA